MSSGRDWPHAEPAALAFPTTAVSSLAGLLVIALAVGLLATSARGQVLGCGFSEDVYPGGEPVGEDGRREVLVTRIVDADTGRPVEGALVMVVEEEDEPTAGSRVIRRSARADAEGWVRLDLKGLERGCGWIFVDAGGYAPQGGYNDLDFPVRLKRGRDLEVRVIDGSDRPLAGVELELILGCGHTPALRRARSDVEGRAVFPDVNESIEGQIWPRGFEVESEYHDWDELFVPGREGVLVLPRAEGVQGRIIDLEGRPVAGALVGLRYCHRGPWVRSDETGRFELPGLDWREDDFEVFPPGFTVERLRNDGDCQHPRPPADFDCLIRVDAEGHVVLPPNERSVELDLRLAEDRAAEEDLQLDLVLVRSEDGFAWREHLDEPGSVRAEIPKTGNWTLVLQDHAGRMKPIRRTIGAAELDAGRIEIELRRRPRGGGEAQMREVLLQLDLVEWDEPSVRLVGANESIDLTEELEFVESMKPDANGLIWDRYAGPIRVPADATCRIEVHWERPRSEASLEARITTHDLGPGLERLELRYPLVAVHATEVLGPDGEAVDASFDVLPRRDGLAAEEAGLHETQEAPRNRPPAITAGDSGFLMVWAREDPGLEPLWFDLATLEHDDGRIDLGSPAMKRAAPRSVSVLRTEDQPAAYGLVEGLPVLQLGEDGRWEPRFATTAEIAGLELLVTDQDEDGSLRLPLKATLEGPGPWRLRWPQRTVELAFEPAWDDSTYTLVLDDQAHRVTNREGRLLIEGLTPGRHRLIVSATGYLATIVDFEIAEQSLRIPIEMRRRP